MPLSRALGAALLTACASVTSPTAFEPTTGGLSLRPALPAQATVEPDSDCAQGGCGVTGRDVRVSLNPHGAAVIDLYERYLRALYNRSIEELRPLLANFVAPTNGESTAPNTGQTREVALAAHARLFQSIDTGARPFATLFFAPLVRTGGTPNAPSSLRARDYTASGDTSGFRRSGNLGIPNNLGMPASLVLLIRFVDDEPRIVGLSGSVLSLRP